MIRISVVVITFNEEQNLAKCLAAAVRVADEIVVVDSHSADGTVAIAEQYGARVIQQAFLGYGQQKNFATAQAANDWILSLDADEVLSEQLISTLLEVKKNPAHTVYQIPRITNYCGKWIRHCGWYPDKQTRLYNRTTGRWVEKQVHEFWQSTDTGTKKGTLKGDLLHYSFTSIAQHISKIEKYSELAARDAVARGRNASVLKIMTSPKWHFFSEYILKLGFLDGYYGYIICRLSEYAAMIKYSKIRQYYQDAQRQIK
jgi:glycosyltransferase involved in cell wall biosynthesis